MTDIRLGCEPWACGGGDVGVLLIHGLHGNPASLRPLAHHLAEHGYAVEMPLLPGHGTRWQDLNRVKRHDWAREVVAAFERLRGRTTRQVAVGLSFGGALALRLAQTRGDDLAGLVLINPWVQLRNPLVPLLPALKRVIPSLPGKFNDIAMPDADELPYDRIPLKGLAEALAVHKAVVPRLGEVHVPTLVFSSRTDNTIDNANGRLILDRISSTDTEQVWLERSYHVATLDYDADEIHKRTVEFVERVTA